MALSPEQKRRIIEKANLEQARVRKLKARSEMEEAKYAALSARLDRAKEHAEKGRASSDTAWVDGGGASFVVDRAEEDQDDEGEDGEGDDGSGEEDNEGPSSGDMQQRQPEKGKEMGSEPSSEDQETRGGGGEPAGQPSPAQQKAQELKEQAKEELKRRAIEAAKKAIKDAIKKALQKALQALLAFLAEWWWVIALIILAIFILVWLFGGFTNKGLEGIGGSHKLLAIPEQDQQLINEIKQLRDDGKLVFADGTEVDLEWEEANGQQQGKLDLRILQTLKYLGTKQELVRVKISRSNGPDMTRRKPVTKVLGIMSPFISRDDEEGADGEPQPIDAISAYATGQAIGIDQVGTFSDEMAAVDECGVTTDTPMDVSLQEVTSENILRPIYEQLSVDSRALYEAVMLLETGNASPDVAVGKSYFEVAGDNLKLVIDNVARLVSEGAGLGMDPRAIKYFAQAQIKLEAVNGLIVAKSGDELAAVWKDRSQTGQPLDDGLRLMFRGMQVRNMWKWYGDTDDGCRLWKAYEVGNAIRKLVVDLMKMPADPMFVQSGTNFNGNMIMAQVVTYSPEDGSLDDNIPVLDVFPNGPKNVDSGGISFDASAADGKVDAADNHFAGLPQDKGVFSRPGTIFVYKLDGWERAGNILADLTPVGGLRQLQEAMDGAGTSTLSGEKADLVSYKNFIHIGV